MRIRRKAYRPRDVDMPKGGRLIQAFKNTDMRCSHDGLYVIAKKEGVDINALEPGEYVAFFNTNRTILKLAAANRVIASRKMESGRFYDLTCISGIVSAFHNDGKIDYDTVLKKRLDSLLQRKGHGTPRVVVTETSNA